jgi:hypothetical protein
MTRDLIVRGFDDQVHAALGRIANQKRVSINSIVKDAVDKWLKHQQEIPKKHHLIIYSDHESMLALLKSMDRLAKESDLFRCYCGPPRSPETIFLSKLKWYDGTPMPYYYTNHSHLAKNKPLPLETILQNIANKSLLKLQMVLIIDNCVVWIFL